LNLYIIFEGVLSRKQQANLDSGMFLWNIYHLGSFASFTNLCDQWPWWRSALCECSY